MPSDHTTSQVFSQETQSVSDAYSALGADEKLALLYYIYEEMGKSITPAAPEAAEPELAPMLLGDFYQLSDDEQLSVMRQIANSEDSEYSRAYGALTENNQLLVWFAWAQGMGETVVDMPGKYQPAKSVTNALSEIKKLEFQEQISVLREIANKMGYSNVHAAPMQAETGKTSSL
jgi:Orange carotenoid protein, N-terminal